MRRYTAKFHEEAHANRVKILVLKGWTRIGQNWISPYTGTMFDERNAIYVEELRKTFKPGYAQRWGLV